VVPADRPEIAVTVMVRGGGEGFDTAEPAAAAILRHYLAHRADILAAGTAAGTPGPAAAAPGPAAASPSTPRTPVTAAPPGAPVTRRSTPAGRPLRRRATRRRR
jgi:hypothetical protein